jgi:hypothetical protein
VEISGPWAASLLAQVERERARWPTNCGTLQAADAGRAGAVATAAAAGAVLVIIVIVVMIVVVVMSRRALVRDNA